MCGDKVKGNTWGLRSWVKSKPLADLGKLGRDGLRAKSRVLFRPEI